MADFVDALRLNIANLMYKGTILVASHASEFLAPKGWSLQLSRGIRAEKPFIDSTGNIVGVISSAARSKSGFNYAVMQHNRPLRHVSPQPLLSSFGDGMPGKTPRDRYSFGYRLARGYGGSIGSARNVYQTEYLTKAVAAKRDFLVSLFERAVMET
ncbi:MAG TPA: hypothetical protein PKY99_00215 [Turneriella sp.]|nr:hypothetical protein [Turneriella sp.]